MIKKITLFVLGVTLIISLVGCSNEADTVSQKLSKSADNFQVQRKVVFFNGITDSAKKLTVTCKVGDDKYKKHYLGLSDNVSYFVEQTDAKYEDAYHYKVIFRPETIVPDIDVKTSK